MASSARHARLASVAGPEQLTRSLAHSPGVAVAARAARTERVLVPRNASDSRSEGGSSPGPQPRPRPRPHAHAHPPLKFRRSVGLCVFSRSHENKVFAARRRDDTSGSWQLPQVRFSCGWGERGGRGEQRGSSLTLSSHSSVTCLISYHFSGWHRSAGEPAGGGIQGVGGRDGTYGVSRWGVGGVGAWGRGSLTRVSLLLQGIRSELVRVVKVRFLRWLMRGEQRGGWGGVTSGEGVG